jgi:PAS domain S-box-containing protein
LRRIDYASGEMKTRVAHSPTAGSDASTAAASVALQLADVPFRGIVEQSLAGIYVVLDERFMYANDTFAAMFGYAREEFIGRHMADCVTPDSVPEVMQNYRRRIRGEVDAIHYFTKGVRKDGQIVHLELHASRVECQGRAALTGVALDVTERVRAQEELRQSRERLRELAQHINAAREGERARMAREVHDVLGGMLTSAKFDLSRILRRTAVPGLEELHGITTDLVLLMQETIDTARAISEEMRPASLDLLGLGEALRQWLAQFARRYGVEVRVTLPEQPLPLAPAVATQVFRIVQEALTNVARHAHATRVELEAGADAQAFWLRLTDDGCGIGAKPGRHGAMGLFSMSERARDIGAVLDVHGGPGGGTELMLRMAWRADDQEPAA